MHDLRTFECATDPNQLSDDDQRKPDIFYDTVTWNISTHPRQNRHFRHSHGNDAQYEIAMCRRRPISASVNTNTKLPGRLWKMTPGIVQLLQISLYVCSLKIIGQSVIVNKIKQTRNLVMYHLTRKGVGHLIGIRVFFLRIFCERELTEITDFQQF